MNKLVTAGIVVLLLGLSSPGFIGSIITWASLPHVRLDSVGYLIWSVNAKQKQLKSWVIVLTTHPVVCAYFGFCQMDFIIIIVVMWLRNMPACILNSYCTINSIPLVA